MSGQNIQEYCFPGEQLFISPPKSNEGAEAAAETQL